MTSFVFLFFLSPSILKFNLYSALSTSGNITTVLSCRPSPLDKCVTKPLLCWLLYKCYLEGDKQLGWRKSDRRQQQRKTNVQNVREMFKRKFWANTLCFKVCARQQTEKKKKKCIDNAIAFWQTGRCLNEDNHSQLCLTSVDERRRELLYEEIFKFTFRFPY